MDAYLLSIYHISEYEAQHWKKYWYQVLEI